MLSLAFAAISTITFAQAKTDSIKVWGNCGSCKEHIEDAAIEAGATSANWNKTSKMLLVSYDASKTSNMKIQDKIASVGYDTQDKKANDSSYNNLDKCCQYERPKAKGQSAINKNGNKAENCCINKTLCNKDNCKTTQMSCCTEIAKHNCYKNGSNCCS